MRRSIGALSVTSCRAPNTASGGCTELRVDDGRNSRRLPLGHMPAADCRAAPALPLDSRQTWLGGRRGGDAVERAGGGDGMGMAFTESLLHGCRIAYLARRPGRAARPASDANRRYPRSASAPAAPSAPGRPRRFHYGSAFCSVPQRTQAAPTDTTRSERPRYNATTQLAGKAAAARSISHIATSPERKSGGPT